MTCFLLVPVFLLCLLGCPGTASQGGDRVNKMEDRLQTMERKLNQYREENGRLQQHNQELHIRVSENEKKNDELTNKISYLEETVKGIHQSNAKCQMRIKHLTKIVDKHFDSFSSNPPQKVNEINTTDSKGKTSNLSSNHIEKRIVSAAVDATDRIAFYAYASTNTAANLYHHTLIFDAVKVNKGQGYHHDDGIFIAPSSGVYVFAWTVAVQDGGWVSAEIVLNGVVFGSNFADGTSMVWDYGSGIAVVEVHSGDHVYIRMHEKGFGVVSSNERGRTSFSGWKLF